jgi:hypothetical protein
LIVRAGRSLRTNDAGCAASDARQHRAANHSTATDLHIEQDAAALVISQVARDPRAVILQLQAVREADKPFGDRQCAMSRENAASESDQTRAMP